MVVSRCDLLGDSRAPAAPSDSTRTLERVAHCVRCWQGTTVLDHMRAAFAHLRDAVGLGPNGLCRIWDGGSFLTRMSCADSLADPPRLLTLVALVRCALCVFGWLQIGTTAFRWSTRIRAPFCTRSRKVGGFLLSAVHLEFPREPLTSCSLCSFHRAGESTPNSQMATVALPLAASLLLASNRSDVSAFAAEMQQYSAALIEPVMSTYGGRWFGRAWCESLAIVVLPQLF
jgi:hypothetical protein